MKNVFIIIFTAVFVLSCGSNFKAEKDNPNDPNFSKPVVTNINSIEDFTLLEVPSGTPESFKNFIKIHPAKAYLLNFFGLECLGCQRELKSFAKNYSKLSTDYIIISIVKAAPLDEAVSWKEEKLDVWLGDTGRPYYLYLDESGEVFKKFATVLTIPFNMFLNSKLEIIKRENSEETFDKVVSEFDAIAAKEAE